MQYEPYFYRAYVKDVYDGDTITAELDLGFNTRLIERIRLFGIDTPEIRGAERPEGIKSRDALRERILHKNIFIKTEKDKKGKYGRYLGTVFIEKDGKIENINQWLVDSGLAEKVDY